MAKILMQRVSWRMLTLVGCDIALIVGAVTTSVYVSLGITGWHALSEAHLATQALLIAGAFQLSLYYGDLYQPPAFGATRELFVRILRALAATSVLLTIIYVLFPTLMIGGNVFAIAVVLAPVAVFCWRVAFNWVSSRVRPRERLLIVGTSPAAVRLARELYERRDLGVEVVGFIDPDPARVGMPVLNPGVVGTVEDIPAYVGGHDVDRVVVSLADARGKLPMDKLLDMKLASGVNFDYLASVYEEYTGKIAVENLRPSWLIFSPGFSRSTVSRAVKRVFDVAGASTALVVLCPALLVIGLAVRLSSRGPILYQQQRVGRHGRIFTIHKFRSMRDGAEALTGAVWSPPGDDRITTLGWFLRRTRLDELPQLWNVITGDMSLVGPRPERPPFVEALTREIPFYGQRHVIRPGLTGWAQVRYTYGTTVEDAMEKLQYDLFYIKHRSFALDLLVVFKTLRTVVLGRNT